MFSRQWRKSAKQRGGISRAYQTENENHVEYKRRCSASISRVLESTSLWRKATAARFPDDPRNVAASKRLDQLAIDAAELSEEEQWETLKPFFYGWTSTTFRDAVSKTAKSIGFHNRCGNLDYFIAVLVRALSASSVGSVNRKMKEFRAVTPTATTPGSLLSQYKLLRAVIDAPWATRLDHKITRSHHRSILWEIRGCSREVCAIWNKQRARTRTNIIESVRRIAEQGVIKVSRQGIGTRPTEYALNFDFASKPSSGPVDDTSTSGPVGNTSSGPVRDTSSAPSGPVDGTESYLLNVPTGTLKVSRNEDAPAGLQHRPCSA